MDIKVNIEGSSGADAFGIPVPRMMEIIKAVNLIYRLYADDPAPQLGLLYQAIAEECNDTQEACAARRSLRLPS